MACLDFFNRDLALLPLCTIEFKDKFMNIPRRNEIQIGMRVQVVEKQNQPSGKLTEGIVARILTSSPTHPHGIKVMLVGGKVGRVQALAAAGE